MNIYEKMLQVMQRVQYLQKDGFVETGYKNGKKTGYQAVTDEKVVSMLRPALIEARLIIVPVNVESKRTDEMVVTKDKDGNEYEKRNRVTDVDVLYRIIDIDNPTDYVDVKSSGCGVDTQDKGIGKAMTYSRKYMLLNTFLIPTGNDTDDVSSEMYDNALYEADATMFNQEMQQQASAQPEAPKTKTADQYRKEIIALAPKKGADIKAIVGADYKGKKWDQLDANDLRDIKQKLAKRPDVESEQ